MLHLCRHRINSTRRNRLVQLFSGGHAMPYANVSAINLLVDGCFVGN